MARRPAGARARCASRRPPARASSSARRAASARSRTSLELPPGFNPRTIAWARAFRADPSRRGATPTQLAQAVLQHIRTQRLQLHAGAGRLRPQRASTSSGSTARKASASTSPPPSSSSCAPPACRRASSPATRAPTCRRSTATTSCARARRTPGPSTGSRGAGWVRADPTGAVAPDRIGRSNRLAPQPGFVAGTLDAIDPQLFAQLRGAWEAVNNRWNQWVLNYSRGQQLDVLKQIGFVAPTWEDLALLLVGALSGLALAGAVWAWLDRHRVDPWVRQLERMKRALRPLGVPAAAHDPPRALAARVRERLGARRRAARRAARRARGAALQPRRRASPRPAHDARLHAAARAGLRAARDLIIRDRRDTRRRPSQSALSDR